MNTKKILTLTVSFLILTSIIISASAPSAYAATDEYTTPSSYPSADLPYSTPAKTQGKFGTCWAFAAVACAEADAIKNHGASKYDIDLSEWHLTYFSYYGEREGTGDSVSLSGNIPYYNVGGFDMLSMLTLSSGIGFADESVAPYSTLLADNSATLSHDLINECEYMLSNVIMLDIKSDAQAIKDAILEYGAVSVTYYSNNGSVNTPYLNSTQSTCAYYCPDSSLVSDHAVTIVGWDDNYSRLNFSRSYRPSRNGAWLVKNSWGDDFGIDGYFYISYEDATLAGGTVFDVVPADEFDTLYQHDGGITLQYVESTNNDEIINIFTSTATTTEILEAVGVAVVKIIDSGSYTLNIYSEPKISSSRGLSYSKWLTCQKGYLHKGYNTIVLDTPLEISAGERFAISIRADANIMVDATESTDIVGRGTHLSSATVSEGETYFRSGAEPYTDASHLSAPWNARIKAYASSPERITPQVIELPSLTSAPIGTPLSKIEIIPGTVTVPDGYTTISGNWSYLDQELIPNDGDEVTLIFTPDDIEKYTTVTVTVKIKLYLIADDGGEEYIPPNASEGETIAPDHEIKPPSIHYGNNEGDFTVDFTIGEETTVEEANGGAIILGIVVISLAVGIILLSTIGIALLVTVFVIAVPVLLVITVVVAVAVAVTVTVVTVKKRRAKKLTE